MKAPRVAVFSESALVHAAIHALAGRVVVVPMPMRDTPADMQRHVAAAHVDIAVADVLHEETARRVIGERPLSVIGDEAPAKLADLPIDHASPRFCLRTSGTTGEPRLIDIPAAAIRTHRSAAMKRLACNERSVWLASLPLWHMGGVGLIDRCLHGGGTLAPSVGSGVPDGITHVSLVPTMLHRLLTTQAPPATLRCALVGGDRLAPALAKAALAAGWPVHASYGLTEACGQVATALPLEVAAHPGTCGMPLAGVRLRIMVGGDEADVGAEGEIVVEGPTLAVAGPLRTGDLGRVDEEGRLFVSGRADDRITSGGEKIHPGRVEAVLRECPGVADAGVVGMPDAEWGQRVVAFIVPSGDPPALAAVRAFARTRLAAHEVPRDVHIADALPRTETGKLRRAALRHLRGGHTVPT